MNWESLRGTLHRTLAEGDYSLFPAPRNESLEAACASWGALHYALTCLLGWKDVGRGMAAWYSDGKPTSESAVLALIQHIWGADDLIDYYAAWAWKPADACYMAPQSVSPNGEPSPTWLAENSCWHDEDWWRAFVRRRWVNHYDPFYGGTDSLHLSNHTGRENQIPSERPLMEYSVAHRTGVLVTEGLNHWIADLEVLQDRLPPLKDRSWHVEVFDRRTGWLGTYRRSRVTGRWFLGKHSVHMMGSVFGKLSG